MAMKMKSVGKTLIHPDGTPLRPIAVVKPATVTRAAAVVDSPPTQATGPIILNGQVTHSITNERLEYIRSKHMADFLDKSIVPLLKPVEKCWQPTDLMPKSDDPDFIDKVRALRERCKNLPDEYLVVFVGDMITEEALPTYMSMLNGLDGVRDETGSSNTPWARWTRAWVAEENRHGDAMARYMFLTGRVNMRSVEVTIQNLISSGMDPKTENNPYLGFLYTSFQERATKISHGNTARHALEYGCEDLAKMAGLIASDEARHEQAYQGIIKYLMDGPDPDGAMLAFGDMMKKQITMPAHLMDDAQHGQNNGKGHNLFADFSAVAERTGTYNAFDYADIVAYLIKKWDVPNRSFKSGEAAAAQEYVLRLPDRIRKLAERADARKKKGTQASFSWVFNRPVVLH